MEYIICMKVIIKSTAVYEKDISKILPSIERYRMEDEIASDPLYWPVIRGTGGVRKARFARDSMGKRGGGRVCYLYLKLCETVYMLKAYSKNDKEDLSEKDKKAIKKVVDRIKEMAGE